MKKIAAICLLLPMILISCRKGPKYKNDVPCDELTAPFVSAEFHSSYKEDKIKFFFENTSLATDHSLIYSTEPTDIDEFGVLRADTPSDAKELGNIVNRYIEDMQKNDRAFIASYAPEELPKLDGARVRVFGNYVAYAILSEDEQEDFLSGIEAKLQ